jgi:hypothetical protein
MVVLLMRIFTEKHFFRLGFTLSATLGKDLP